jgi:hypothetical protein
LDPERDKDAGDINDLFERKDRRFSGKRRLAVWQAIKAPEIATVRKGNAKIADNSVVSVAKHVRFDDTSKRTPKSGTTLFERSGVSLETGKLCPFDGAGSGQAAQGGAA